jgi:hypothetical protein
MGDIDKYFEEHFGIGGDDEDTKIYKANELLFAIDNLSYLDDEEKYGLDLRTVVIVPIDFWEAEHGMADFIGAHNVDNDALRNAGMCDGELSEGVFEFWGKDPGMLRAIEKHDWDLIKRYSRGYTDEYMIQMISGAGFIYSQELTDIISK